MKKVRSMLAIITVGLMVLGYAGSQYAALAGDPVDWAHRVDQQSVVMLSLVLVVAAIVCALVRDRDDERPSS